MALWVSSKDLCRGIAIDVPVVDAKSPKTRDGSKTPPNRPKTTAAPAAWIRFRSSSQLARWSVGDVNRTADRGGRLDVLARTPTNKPRTPNCYKRFPDEYRCSPDECTDANFR